MAPARESGLPAALELLERAVGYARLSLHAVSGVDLAAPTPCSEWTLRGLLVHMSDSLAALQEAAESGRVTLRPPPPTRTTVGLVSGLRDQACALVGAWTRNDGSELVRVSGSALHARVLAATGALEIAVHGWDVAATCGLTRPLPPAFACELLALIPFLVADADRPARFAAPLAVGPDSPPGDRLLAALGRDPA